eukprot:2353502-Alexandrium_andersonii.AAC.1
MPTGRPSLGVRVDSLWDHLVPPGEEYPQCHAGVLRPGDRPRLPRDLRDVADERCRASVEREACGAATQ